MRFMLALSMLAALTATPAIGQGAGKGAKADEPKTLREHAEKSVLRIQNQLRNARSRLDNGIVGMIDGSRKPKGLGEQCCGKNVDRISRISLDLDAVVDALESCYSRSDILGQETNLQYVRQDIALIRSAADVVKNATDGATVHRSLADTTRAFFGLKKDIAPLPECGDADDLRRALGQ